MLRAHAFFVPALIEEPALRQVGICLADMLDGFAADEAHLLPKRFGIFSFNVAGGGVRV